MFPPANLRQHWARSDENINNLEGTSIPWPRLDLGTNRAILSSSRRERRCNRGGTSMSVTGHDTLKTRRTLKVGSKSYDYFSLEAAAAAAGLGDIARLPFSMKVLLENLVRLENGRTVTVDDIKAVAEWLKSKTSDREIAFRPARVLMQDFTGVPAVVDLAAMRQQM